VTFQRGNESLARSRARPREDERTLEVTRYPCLRWLNVERNTMAKRTDATRHPDTAERARSAGGLTPGPQDERPTLPGSHRATVSSSTGGPLSFASSETSKTVDVTVLGDRRLEQDGTYVV